MMSLIIAMGMTIMLMEKEWIKQLGEEFKQIQEEAKEDKVGNQKVDQPKNKEMNGGRNQAREGNQCS